MEAGVGVAHRVRRDGILVGVPGHPGEPGCVLDDEGEGRVVPPRSVEPEPRHADHDEVGPFGAEGIDVEADLLEHPRRVVLDHDVAGGEQVAQQLAAPVGGQVQRHARLVGVQAREDAGLLPPVGLREADAGQHAGPVGPGRRLDVQHVGAQHGQNVGAQRAGPERGQIENPQPLERQGRRRDPGDCPRFSGPSL